jgi:hypothetical protein
VTEKKSIRAKQGPITLIVLVILLVLYFIFGRNNANTRIDKREKAFRHNEIKLTTHARCRMDCRNINETEVKDILENGSINYRKSDLKDKPCPTYALEGITKDNQRVRVVVGDCNNEAVIITVIDLDHEFECHCE